MKCPKCQYVSFDDLATCKKCGAPLRSLTQGPYQAPWYRSEGAAPQPAPRAWAPIPLTAEHRDVPVETARPAPAGPEFARPATPGARFWRAGMRRGRAGGQATSGPEVSDTGAPTLFPTLAAPPLSPAESPWPTAPPPEPSADLPAGGGSEQTGVEALLRERDLAAQAALQAQAIRVYADPVARAAALLVDLALLALTALVCFLAGIGLVSRETLAEPQGLSTQVVRLMVVPYALLLLVFMLGYFTYFHGTSGQTLGKMLLGLRVVQAQGGPLGLDLAFLRAVGYLLSALLVGGGFLWALFDSDHQGLHDKLAGSYVVRTRG